MQNKRACSQWHVRGGSRRVLPVLELCPARISCSRLCRFASQLRSSCFRKYAFSGVLGSRNCASTRLCSDPEHQSISHVLESKATSPTFLTRLETANSLAGLFETVRLNTASGETPFLCACNATQNCCDPCHELYGFCQCLGP